MKEFKKTVYAVVLMTVFGSRTMAFASSVESAQNIADDLSNETGREYKLFKKVTRKPRARIMMPKRA